MRSPHRIAIALTSAVTIAVAIAVGAGGATTSRTAWSRLSGRPSPVSSSGSPAPRTASST